MHKNILKQVYFIITRRCNLICSHCIRSSGPGIEDHLTFEKIDLTFKKILPYARDAHLIISGGEPSLHTDFKKIIISACAQFKNVVINTNGLRTKLLCDLSPYRHNITIQISIDGDECFHNKIRGHNAFSRSIRSIKALSNFGIEVIISTTLGKKNLASTHNLDHYLFEIPFLRWVIQREVIYGRASSQNALTTKQWNDFVLVAASEFKNRDRIVISSMFDFLNLTQKLKKTDKKSIVTNCGTGKSKIYINPDLTVFPCGCLEETILGNLATEKFDTILTRMCSMPIHPTSQSPCKVCPFLKVCNGGCPGSSLHTFGSFGVGDPRCSAVKDLLLGKG